MLRRFPYSFRPVPFALAALLLVPVVAPAQTEVPRAAAARPDLSGVWNFSTATPMQRPEELAGKERLTAEEAAEYEALLAERRRAGDSTSPTASLEARVGYEQAIWFERGAELAEYRTSLIVDPPNGRIPPEDRGPSERCLMGFNSGPPTGSRLTAGVTLVSGWSRLLSLFGETPADAHNPNRRLANRGRRARCLQARRACSSNCLIPATERRA